MLKTELNLDKKSSLGWDLNVSQSCLATARNAKLPTGMYKWAYRIQDIWNNALLCLMLEGPTWRTVLFSAPHSSKDGNHLEEIQRRARRTTREPENLLSWRNVEKSCKIRVLEKSLSQISEIYAKRKYTFVVFAVAKTGISWFKSLQRRLILSFSKKSLNFPSLKAVIFCHRRLVRTGYTNISQEQIKLIWPNCLKAMGWCRCSLEDLFQSYFQS